jgi:phosphate transport system protein
MSIHLHRDLDRLQRKILDLASTVEDTVDKAIRALCNRDADLANRLLEQDVDHEIDVEETQIEDECLKMLALHQPVAVDLRRIACILKINSDLERMADLAVNIAERAVALIRGVQIPVPPTLRRMTDLTTTMMRDSLDAFVRLDAQLARRICRLDEQVDQYNREIIEHLIRTMKQSPEFIEPGLSLFSASRHVERIADHCTNIAEDVVYLVEGAIIRHHPEAIAEPASP